jgi:hypothetical protein
MRQPLEKIFYIEPIHLTPTLSEGDGERLLRFLCELCVSFFAFFAVKLY